MKITVSISIEIEEADGDGNTFALRRAVSAGDNPAFTRDECEKVATPAVRELLGRVGGTYPVLR